MEGTPPAAGVSSAARTELSEQEKAMLPFLEGELMAWKGCWFRLQKIFRHGVLFSFHGLTGQGKAKKGKR